jgi:hypothetical protein
MNDEGRKEAPGKPESDATGASVAPSSQRRELVPLPALVVVALYMFVLAGINVIGVANGYARAPYLVFSVSFIAAALGLLLLFRWAWTLTLAAVVLLAGLFFWRFTTQHDVSSLMQGGLNLVIFLYLIRPEVRAHLR